MNKAKLILSIVWCLIFSGVVLAQNNAECKKHHKGKFKISSEETGITIIKRRRKKQIETDDKKTYKSVSEIVWISDCVYELRNGRLIKGPEFLRGKPTDVFRVEILEVSSKKMTVRTTANFSDLVRDTELIILR